MKRFFLLLLAAIIGLLPLMSACAEAPLDGYPGIDELPAIDTINNPFEFFDVKNDPNGDGIVTDITEWEARRTEIRDLIQHYWLGYRWETAGRVWQVRDCLRGQHRVLRRLLWNLGCLRLQPR